MNLKEKDKRHIIHPWSDLGSDADSMIIESGKGVHVFDSEGKPININPPSLALEYYADEALVERSWGSKTKVNPSYKSKTKVSSALKAPKVANDPSCRWLDNRISYLQRKLRPGTQNQQHFEREMTARLGEWKCLKCETKGPSQGDHALCQYKR